ncbi:predicted protein [Pyrenophora tritici-repentis Pt-1C-BFP]|uniref:Uncharacterized protein n=1 Tax=Pyrenophora tritici-repentis (strain Pt-1C-BFP) TaxID=426418 RepID=B2VUS0_PYRTR|nr:uncharacterized protein PTRG_02174 [Pyrenophora tritici-repentis Pt-1C-BFP]EDU41612.1 predicted protein [Pyrenophora tritici-repentis Pt-1C-BFP]
MTLLLAETFAMPSESSCAIARDAMANSPPNYPAPISLDPKPCPHLPRSVRTLVVACELSAWRANPLPTVWPLFNLPMACFALWI